MDDIVTDLTQRFRNLGGTNFAEHKRNFNEFKSSLAAQNGEQIDQFLKQLSARNMQEDLFRVELLMQYEQYDLLEEVLYGSNRILAKLILRNIKFIQNFMTKITVEQFLTQICPKISYVTRLRFINKFAKCIKDPVKCEAYFEAVQEYYGIKSAVPLLENCSENFVRQFISEYNCYLKDDQLIHLHKESKSFLNFYFEDCGRSFEKYKKLGKYLCDSDVVLFRRLLNFGTPLIGKKAFVKFLNMYKEDVIECKVYKEKYHRTVYNNVNKNEYLLYIQNRFPENYSDLRLHQYFGRLKIIPVKDRGSFVFAIYEKLYGVKFNGWYYQLPEMISNEDRQKLKLDEEEFVEYLEVTKAIALIKQKISVTATIPGRSSLLNKLILTCKINRAPDMLPEIMEYFLKMHKNEPVAIRREFLMQLHYKFRIENLDQRCWDVIDELLLLFEVNNEDFQRIDEFLARKILRHDRLGIDVREELTRYFKARYSFNNFDVNIGQARKYFLFSLTLISEDEKDELFYLLDDLVNFNDSCMRNKVKCHICYFEYPEIIKKFIQLLCSDDQIHLQITILQQVFFDVPKDSNRRIVWYELLKLFLQKFPKSTTGLLARKLIRNHPELLVRNGINLIMDRIDGNTSRTLAYQVFKSHFNKLNEKVTQVALEMVESSNRNISNIIDILSFTENYPQLEFTGWSRKYYFKKYKRVTYSNNHIEMLLSHVDSEDFRLALPSIYSMLYHLPEEQTEVILRGLLKKNVCARKHAVHIISQIMKNSECLNIFQAVYDTDRNYSTQKTVLKKMFQHGSLDAFPLQEVKLANIHPELLAVSKIRKSDQASYAVIICKKLLWHKSNKLFTIIQYLNLEIIKQLQTELCNDIFDYSFLNPDNAFLNKTNEFVYYCLQTNKIEWERVCEAMKSYVENSVCLIDKGKRFAVIYNIYEQICKKFINGTSKDLPNRLLNSANCLAYNQIKLEMLLITTNAYLDNTTISFIINYHGELERMDLQRIFACFLKDFFESIHCCQTNWEYDWLVLIDDLIDKCNTIEFKLFLIELLRPEHLNRNAKIDRMYYKIIAKLRQNSPVVADMYLTAFISKSVL